MAFNLFSLLVFASSGVVGILIGVGIDTWLIKEMNRMDELLSLQNKPNLENESVNWGKDGF